MKKYKFSIISLLTAFILAVVAAVLALNTGAAAFASDRYVTVDGSNVFYTSIRGAEVTSAKETVKDGDKEEEQYFTFFKIGKDEDVSYRKSLAYKWITGEKDEDGNPTGIYEERHFSMQIGFEKANFKRFIIKFQSQQYKKTEDDITENFLVFAPAEEGKVKVAAVQSLEDEITTYPVTCDIANNARINISFNFFNAGDIKVKVNESETDLEFKNVYEPYASYVSSGDNAVTPLTFSAEFEEGAQPAEGEDELTAGMKLYELNGQSFRLYANDSDGVYNDVLDNAPPVMCFTKTPSYVEFSKELDFDYQVLDVLASSPRSTAYFYVLTGKQYDSDTFKYSQTEYEETESDTPSEGEEQPEVWDNPYTKVSSSSSISIQIDENTFIPSRYLEGGADYSEDFSVYGLIKIYYEISDVSGSSAQTDKVFVDWYAKPQALVNIYSADFKDKAGTENFIKIIDGKRGATYAPSYESNLTEYKQEIDRIEQSYQEKIVQAIAEQSEDGKLYAGSENNFYLPKFEEIAGDEYSYLQDYKYSIYYKAKTSGSNTSLAYNKMAIPLSEPDVTYRFTIFIVDSFGNPMCYPTDEIDDNGNTVWKEITADDVWEEDFAELLPFFEFYVYYKPATAENPETLSLAYVGTSYSGVSFKINGVSGTYTTNYNLYIFDRNAAYKEIGLDMTYTQFSENYEKLFNNTYDADKNTRKYFKTVKAESALKETDPDYELFKAIKWNPANVSFVPQNADDFYLVSLTITDNRAPLLNDKVNFAVVAASVQTTALKGESDWLENNIASVVLLSIAGVCFIALVVLLIVKPKDKGDIDAVFDNTAKGKNKGNKNK